MKIKKELLKEFLGKVTMTGAQQINECLLNFDKEGLKINANAPSSQSRVEAWLKTSGFQEYENIGKIGMNDLVTVIKVIERFDDVISIKKEGNLLTLSEKGKKVDVELISESFLSTDTGNPNLEYEETFVLPIKKFKSFIKDVQLNKDATLTIESKEKKVLFSNTGKYKFFNELDAETVKGGKKSTFSQPLIDATLNLTQDLEVSLGSDYPLKLIEKDEFSIINLIVAPRIEEDN